MAAGSWAAQFPPAVTEQLIVARAPWPERAGPHFPSACSATTGTSSTTQAQAESAQGSGPLRRRDVTGRAPCHRPPIAASAARADEPQKRSGTLSGFPLPPATTPFGQAELRQRNQIRRSQDQTTTTHTTARHRSPRYRPETSPGPALLLTRRVARRLGSCGSRRAHVRARRLGSRPGALCIGSAAPLGRERLAGKVHTEEAPRSQRPWR